MINNASQDKAFPSRFVSKRELNLHVVHKNVFTGLKFRDSFSGAFTLK
jgi:hypothetical protein